MVEMMTTVIQRIYLKVNLLYKNIPKFFIVIIYICNICPFVGFLVGRSVIISCFTAHAPIGALVLL